MDDRLFQEDASYSANGERKIVELGPFDLRLGGRLEATHIAYQTWGDPKASRVVLVCHAISGDANAVGWWDRIVGPGRAIDTKKCFVVCSNTLGGCQGSTGPASLAPDGARYGSRFPAITVEDMVDLQIRLFSHLGINRPALVCGGSMGGMQAIEWARRDATDRVWLAASAARHSAMQIGFNEAARQAIMADPAWNGGDYSPPGPAAGLAVARMIGHLSYLSDAAFESKFGRKKQTENEELFQVESYLRYQGHKFTQRFDANSLLVLSRAIDRYDCTSLAGSKTRILATAFTSDWLYPPRQSEEIAAMAARDGVDCRYELIDLPYGHDAFLLDDVHQAALVREFLAY